MANNRKKGSPAGVIFALLMLIVIVIALVIVLRSCSAQDGGEGSTPTPPANTETVVNSPENTPAQPSGTPAGESAPPSPSATPSETPEPTPSPTPAPANASGHSTNCSAHWTFSANTSATAMRAATAGTSRAFFSCSPCAKICSASRFFGVDCGSLDGFRACCRES